MQYDDYQDLSCTMGQLHKLRIVQWNYQEALNKQVDPSNIRNEFDIVLFSEYFLETDV